MGVHRVYASCAQEALLEGHVTAFAVTGGVPTAGPQCPAAGEERPVPVDRLLGIDGFITHCRVYVFMSEY
jgi:hypothetical protein